MDQKANSVADMAAVLADISPPGGGDAIDGGMMVSEGKKGSDVVVEVRWRDLLDAEFARTWPENVIHDVLEGGSVESAYGAAVKAAEETRAAREAAAAPKGTPAEKPEERVTV